MSPTQAPNKRRRTKACEDCPEKRQLELIQRLSRTGYWEYDPEAGGIELSPSSALLLSAILGVEAADGQAFMQAIQAPEPRRFQEVLDQALAGRLNVQIELRLACRDASQAYVAVRGEPELMDDGDIRLVGSFQDITREKRIEADREAVIGQLQALLTSLPLGVTAFDAELRLIFWNEPIYDILGLPRQAVYRYARFEDLIRYPAERGEYGPGDPQQLVRERMALARRFEAHRLERTNRDGRTLLVEGYPIRSGGQIAGFVTTYTDITERKQREEEIAHQHDILRTIIDNFPGAISLFDADLRMAACNEQFRTLLDLPEALLAQPVLNFEDIIRYNVQRGEYGPGDVEERVAAIVARARDQHRPLFVTT